MRFSVLFVLALAALPAFAQTKEDEAKIRAVIADWYERVSHAEARTPWALFAPGSVDGGPGYAEIPWQARQERSAAAYSGPMINNELASKAMKFAYDVDVLKIDPRFAKILVWERGYFFASAAQVTYENAASTMFVFEKQADGRWLILLHQASSIGIPPNKITNPMPDLRAEYYERCGAACDPVADARKAKEF